MVQTARRPRGGHRAPSREAADPSRWSDQAVSIAIVGVVLIAAQLALRGWALSGSWFYSDDLEFLADATGTPLRLGFLLTPHDSQLMPGGVLVTWVVARAGAFAWPVAAASTLAMQLAADLACWWALRQLFGHRWQVLVLLAAYLFWPLTFTSFMWWAAALNHVPLQAAAFLAVGCLALARRTGNRRWTLATAGAVVLGLCFYVKAALLVLPLGLLYLLHLNDWSQGVRRGAADILRRTWPLAVLLAAILAAYTLLYTSSTPSPLTGTAAIEYGEIADGMFRRSLAPALLGGPWAWFTPSPPISLVGTPETLSTLSLAAVAAGVAVVLVRRPGAWRALAVAAPYLALAFWLTARGRGPGTGGVPGLLLRYLADSTPWLVIAAGLLVLPLRSDLVPRPPQTADATAPAAGARVRRRIVAGAALGCVLAGAVWSSISFASHWRSFASRTYVQNVQAEAEARPLLLLDEPVSRRIASVTAYENTLPSRLLKPLRPRVRAVETATDPLLLDAEGRPTVPLVTDGASSAPGPEQDCGYAVGSDAAPVALSGTPERYDWWVSVAYYAGEATTMQVRLGERTWDMPVERGAHRWFTQGSGAVGDLVLGGTDDGKVVCVTGVDVGDVIPFGPA